MRRYVVETPVEEQVALQDEKVVVDRRPVTGGQPVATFTDKIIEMTETHEEPVISKLPRVTEEVKPAQGSIGSCREGAGYRCAATRSKLSRCPGPHFIRAANP